jgi:hypothetical protein
MSETVGLLLFERLMVDVSKFRILERSYDDDLEGTMYHVATGKGESLPSIRVMILDSEADDEATGFTAASFVVEALRGMSERLL